MNNKIKTAITQLSPKTYVDLFKIKYREKISDDDISNILNKSKEIAEKMKEEPGLISLLVGQIQSGKTASLISVISNMFDFPNSSNLCMVFPAVDNILLQQSLDRIDYVFSSKEDCVVIDIRSENYLDKIITSLSTNKKIIIVSLKQSLRITKCVEILKNSAVRRSIKNPFFIDDEGDQASFDNQNYEHKSSIHELITSLKTSCEGLSMLVVTATPMAQILVDEEYEIKPDFVYYIKPGKNYFSLEKFIEEKNSHIQTLKIYNHKDYFDTNVTPESIKKSLLSFFIASALIHLKNEDYTFQSMLLYVERRQDYHELVSKDVNNFISSFEHQMISYRSLLKKDTENILDTFPDHVIPNEVKENLDDFLELLRVHMNNSKVIIVNNKNKSNMNLSALNSPKKHNYIFIGMNMLQRGVTIPNLIHTFLIYRPDSTISADTVLQRARWLGYRNNQEYIKVFLTNEAKNDFISLYHGTSDILEKIDDNNKKRLSFKSFERSIYLPYSRLKGTRDTVIKNRKLMFPRYTFDASIKNSDFAEEYFNKLSSLETKYILWPMKEQSFYGLYFHDFNGFQEWVGKEKIKIFYNDLFKDKRIQKGFSDFIEIEKPHIYIVNMKRHGTNEDFSIRSEDNGYINVAQGPSDFGEKYVGDRYWYKYDKGQFANSIIIQLFKIKLKDNNKVIYKVAICAPKLVHGFRVFPSE